jgi:homoserine kinase
MTSRTRIVVPGSSANLGSGFDVLGMALTITAEIGVVNHDDDGVPDGAEIARGKHPAATAFSAAGGSGQVWVRTSIPSGRGLGFSGAVRVGAIALARQQMSTDDVLLTEREAIFDIARREEGHGDNVGASLVGGVVVVADSIVSAVPLAVDPAVVVWIPAYKTTTAESRAALSSQVSRDDAVFNMARVGLWVNAMATGDLSLLVAATADRLHQDARLAAVPRSRQALDAMKSAGAHGAWLSGSGPTVACLCETSEAERISDSLPEGRRTILRIDRLGARWAD